MDLRNINSTVIVLLAILLLFFYFLPSFIADIRKVKHAGWIYLLNIFFGWTILGWLAGIIWACTEELATTKPVPRDKVIEEKDF